MANYFKAKYIVVWKDGSHHILENGYLAVEGKRIAGFMNKLPEGTPFEDLGNAAIIPGFINLHTHPSEVFSIKSYIEDCGNPFFYESTLMDYPFPSLGQRGAEIQTTLNLIELVKSGCTTSLIYGGPYSRLEAETAGNMGLRAYVGAGIRAGDRMEADSIWHSPDGHSVTYDFDEVSGFERIKEARDLVKDYDGSFDGRVHIMMGPTQSMTCTPAMLKETRKAADELGVGITIHVAEDLAEFESCARLYGKTPVELLRDTGLLGEDVILAHCVFISNHSQVFIKNDIRCSDMDLGTVRILPFDHLGTKDDILPGVHPLLHGCIIPLPFPHRLQHLVRFQPGNHRKSPSVHAERVIPMPVGNCDKIRLRKSGIFQLLPHQFHMISGVACLEQQNLVHAADKADVGTVRVKLTWTDKDMFGQSFKHNSPLMIEKSIGKSFAENRFRLQIIADQQMAVSPVVFVVLSMR